MNERKGALLAREKASATADRKKGACSERATAVMRCLFGDSLTTMYDGGTMRIKIIAVLAALLLGSTTMVFAMGGGAGGGGAGAGGGGAGAGSAGGGGAASGSGGGGAGGTDTWKGGGESAGGSKATKHRHLNR
jgi:hypothetical protein